MENEQDCQEEVNEVDVVVDALMDVSKEYANVERNTFFTRMCIEDDITRTLMELDNEIGFKSFDVKCDSSNNPDDGEQLRVDVFLRPKMSLGVIELIILVDMKGEGKFEDNFARAMKGV